MNSKRTNRHNRKNSPQNYRPQVETNAQLTRTEVRELFPSPEKIEHYEKVLPGISEKIFSTIIKLNEQAHEGAMEAFSVEKKAIEDNGNANKLKYKQSRMSFLESVLTKILVASILISILLFTMLVLKKDPNNTKIWLTFLGEIIAILSLYFKNHRTK